MNNNYSIKNCLSSPQSLISFMEKSKDHWFIKDRESKYIYMNQSALIDFNAPKNFNIEGKLDKEIPLKASQELWNDFVKHDQGVIKENRNISAIEIHYYGKGNIDTPTPHFSEKMPLYDDKNEVIGIVCHARIIDVPTLLYYMNRLNRKTIQLGFPNSIFTKREMEVIFWTQQKISVKEIAKRLELSTQTVIVHFKNIYKKAGVHSINQLIEYCKHTGLDGYIPNNFVRKGVQIIE
ncbi:PAS and helix-turn-helix domain-containing protein [Arsenophonus apicola]|uniref:LuxR C-terminal-related transcriptional regulator n=2 Tax=Arsenophonus apicola TaxID=2879119 RepID=A0ABY8NYR4_9GAMM|nr:PAS and helix-turn-helix domain-containing protein [Arsenophonus apicola]WGO82124.1 LuxR C-terminal-related transcriptional regulator [Arsenophonus apicola]